MIYPDSLRYGTAMVRHSSVALEDFGYNSTYLTICINALLMPLLAEILWVENIFAEVPKSGSMCFRATII